MIQTDYKSNYDSKIKIDNKRFLIIMKIITTFMKQFVFLLTFLNFFNNSLFQLLPKLTKDFFIVVKSKSKLSNCTT